ncbi:MAG: Cellulosome-anchoring protein [Syntrophomonadaceae bacterium]|nr:Cellulosome-anchoring protein [Bacillota bacterium]
MNLLKRCISVFAVMLAVALVWVNSAEGTQPLRTSSLEHGNRVRTFSYYVPTGHDIRTEAPLVISLHGLGSSGAGQAVLTGAAAVAEQNGFIVAFPNCFPLTGTHPNLPALPGANLQWNIGIDMSLQYRAGVDDVGFISELIDYFAEKYNIDLTRVYVKGMSNGAMLAYRLAIELSDRIAAVAGVTAPMTVNFAEAKPQRPVSVIIMMGDQDPVVPYAGGRVFLHTEATAAFWAAANGIATVPQSVYLPLTAAGDPTLIRRTSYTGGLGGAEVILYTIIGGGHTWPDGPQYAPIAAIGRVSRHINGSRVIWEHFAEHSLGRRAAIMVEAAEAAPFATQEAIRTARARHKAALAAVEDLPDGEGKKALIARLRAVETRFLPALADIADHWGRSSIKMLAGKGIVSGYPDGKFRPEAGITRAEFVAMLTRALELAAKPETAARFKDAAGFGWAKGAIGAAVDAGLVAGMPDGKFTPARQITRAEIAAILARVVERRLVPVPTVKGVEFADAGVIPAWAAAAVRKANTAGLVRGFPDGTFRPGRSVTRAETAAMLHRLVAER